jgi:hypothetical protein
MGSIIAVTALTPEVGGAIETATTILVLVLTCKYKNLLSFLMI